MPARSHEPIELKRRVPRQNAGWPGTYRIPDAPDTTSGSCQVIDISVLGVGVELFDAVPGDLIGRRIVIDVVTPAGASVTIGLAGDVRNTGAGARGGTRVGVEFTGISPLERSILEAIERFQIVW